MEPLLNINFKDTSEQRELFRKLISENEQERLDAEDIIKYVLIDAIKKEVKKLKKQNKL